MTKRPDACPAAAYPTLRTARLLLRGLEPDDVDTLYRLSNHEAVAANLSDMPHPYPRQAAQGLVSAMRELGARGEAYGFAITPVRLEGGDTLAGMVYLIPEMARSRAELIYWLGPAYWGQGYATEAAQRVVSFGFETLKLHRIHASCFASNSASASVLLKIGLRRTGGRPARLIKEGRSLALLRFGRTAGR